MRRLCGVGPARPVTRGSVDVGASAGLHRAEPELEPQGPALVPVGARGSALPDGGAARAGRARTVARVLRGRVLVGSDAGMATAEYAIATVAAVGFAGLLVVVLRSGEVQGLLLGLIRGALSV